MEEFIDKFNYVLVVILMMTGLWSMLAQKKSSGLRRNGRAPRVCG